MSRNQHFSEYFQRVNDALTRLDHDELKTLVGLILQCREEGKTMYIFGNGGSAATASHVAGDFLKGISYGLEKRFKTICLSDNTPGMSAISNDLSYDEVFVEPLKTFMQPGDLVVGISGSGNSVNVLKAIAFANDNGAKTVGLCGFKGGKLIKLARLTIHVPIEDMEVTEDVHLLVFHAIKQLIIKELKGDRYSMGETYDKRVQE